MSASVFFKKLILLGGTCLTAGAPLLAQAGPWVLPQSSNFIAITSLQQNAKEFYRADTLTPLPDLSMSVLWVTYAHGLTDTLTLEAQIGYARSTFDALGVDSLSGLVDSTVGVNWQFLSEYSSDGFLPTASLRAALIVAGDYDLGQENSIGDGGDGYELSLNVGKYLTNALALSAELGYRDRSNEIPSENFLKLKAETFINEKIGLSVMYTNNDARDGLQIGIPPFSKARFPELEEDYELVNLGVSLEVTPQVTLAATGGRVIDGRNTGKSNVYSVGLGYGF